MKYQDLIDADVSEFDIERMIGEGWTLQQIAEQRAPHILPSDIARVAR